MIFGDFTVKESMALTVRNYAHPPPIQT